MSDSCVAWLRSRSAAIVTYEDGQGQEARRNVLASLDASQCSLIIAARDSIPTVSQTCKAVGLDSVICGQRHHLEDILNHFPKCYIVTPQAFTTWGPSILREAGKSSIDSFVHLDPTRIRKAGALHTRLVLRTQPIYRRFIICGRVLTPIPSDIWPAARMMGLTDQHVHKWTYEHAVIKRIGHIDVPVDWKRGALDKVREMFRPHTFMVSVAHNQQNLIQNERPIQ